MTITTEETERLAERLSNDAEAPQSARYQPYTDHAMCNAAAALRSLAAERDALRAENANLRDDLAGAERERAHQQGRADRNAAEYAREQKKREQLQAENARLREAIKAAFAEGFSAGREEGLEDGLVRPEGVYSRCDSKTEQSYWQDSHARAALGEKE